MKTVQEVYKYYGIKFEEYVPNTDIDIEKCIFVPNLWLKHRKAETLTAYVVYPKTEISTNTNIQLRIQRRSANPRHWRQYAANVIFGADSFEEAELKCKRYNESGITDTADNNLHERLVSSLKIKTRYPQNARLKATMRIKKHTPKTAIKRYAQPDGDIETKRAKEDKTAKKIQKTCRLPQDTSIGPSNDVNFNKQNGTPKDMAGANKSLLTNSPNFANQSFNPRNSREAESREQAFCNALYVQFSELQEKFVNMRLMFNNLRATYIQSLEEVKTLVNSINNLRNNIISASPAPKNATAAVEVQKTLTEGELLIQDVHIEVIDDDDKKDEASDKERDQTHSSSFTVPPEHSLKDNICASSTPQNATAAAEVQTILTEGEQNNLDVKSEVIDDDKNEDVASDTKRDQTGPFPFATSPEHAQRNNISASPTPKDATAEAMALYIVQQTLCGKELNEDSDDVKKEDEAPDNECDPIDSLKYPEYTSAPGLVALRSHNNAYPVYLRKTELDMCKLTAENCTTLTGMLLNEIFTETALEVEAETDNGLDERALDEVRKFVKEYADLKGWYKLDEHDQKLYY